MPARKARSDASVESWTRKAHDRLGLSSRYTVVIYDTRTRRRVRADASIGALRRKGTKDT